MSNITTEVSEVVTQSSVKELKPGELPGSREAVYSMPSDVAMQVLEVTTQGKNEILITVLITVIISSFIILLYSSNIASKSDISLFNLLES